MTSDQKIAQPNGLCGGLRLRLPAPTSVTSPATTAAGAAAPAAAPARMGETTDNVKPLAEFARLNPTQGGCRLIYELSSPPDRRENERRSSKFRTTDMKLSSDTRN